MQGRRADRLRKATRWLTAAFLLALVLGALLEAVLGRQFLMVGARAYRAAAGEYALVILLGAALLTALLYTFPESSRRYPTKWLRVFVVPLMIAATLAALLVGAPLGWIAALGWVIGQPVQDVPARVVEVNERQGSGKGCGHEARIEVPSDDALLCVRGLVVGDRIAAGDAVLLAGKQSSLGLYVRAITKR
jgi:hypothetical protein